MPEKKNPQDGMATEQEVQQPTQSAKDRYRSRYSAAHPELNMDDEEAFYNQANANLDELEDYRNTNKQLGEAFDRTPLLAGLVLAARNGENPFAWLAENIGPDMDIRELASNPEFSKTMGESLLKYEGKMSESKKRNEEIGKNALKSIETLKEIQQERGLTDEEAKKMAYDFFGDIDEDGKPVGKESFMQLASKGVVTKDMWNALFNARNYDKDIATASDKARATALNEKVENNLRNFNPTGMPKSMSTGGTGKGEQKKRGNSLADFGKQVTG
jgi:hypothetical protein